MIRNETERLCLVVNPHSAGGATGGRLEALRRAAEERFAEWEIRETQGPGHATAIAAEAVADGFDLVVAVGGDGTASETVNGLFEGSTPRNPEVVFSVIPAGTGSDLVRTLGMPRRLEEAMDDVAASETRPCDVLEVLVKPHGGEEPMHRLCINVTSFGISGDIVHQVNQGSKRFGGTATFLGATLRALASYRPEAVRLSWVDAEGDEGSWEGDLVTAFVANGQYCGGGMWIGRGGSMDDGAADLVLVPRLPLFRQATGLPKLYTGKADQVPGVIRERVVSLEAEAQPDAMVRVDVDGEHPGTLPLKVRVLPSMLKIRGTWP